MQNKTIRALNKELNAKEADMHEIESKLQKAWDDVFSKSKVIKDMVAKLESSNDFTWDRYNEIYSYVSVDLSDFKECKQYFENYMQEFHYINVDWDNDFLLYSQGESITIQDDTRNDNGVWFGQKCIIEEKEYKNDGELNETKRNELIEAYMEKMGEFPGVFRTDTHGNIFLVNTTIQK
jgi:hypothetical protein